MRNVLILIFVFISPLNSAQMDDRVSTMDFVEILNNHKKEALFYYKNNWMELRIMAVEKKYIHSFQLLETPATVENPYHLILISTYENKEQFDKREENFSKLMDKRERKLMNDLQPKEFRKILYSKKMVKHLY